MKTSKRLLSILLMLTMLLSMFTVMASADDPEEFVHACGRRVQYYLHDFPCSGDGNLLPRKGMSRIMNARCALQKQFMMNPAGNS